MITVKKSKYETLAVPDVDTCGSIIALYDNVGWATIGVVGHDAITIDRDEWVGFVNFINELNAHMRAEGVGPYALERT